MKLKFFASPAYAASYVTNELVATLRDDLEQMTERGERSEMRRRIHDVEAVSGLMQAAPALLEALKQLIASSPEIAQATDDDLCAAIAEGDDLLRGQAAAFLQARAAIAKATV